MVKSGPDVSTDEVEVSHLASVEVMVLWDSNVLNVSHLTPPRSYYVGEEFAGTGGCDYFIPSETLGTTRAPVVVSRGGSCTGGDSGTINLAVADIDNAAAGLTRYEAEGAFALSLTRQNAIHPEAIWELKAQTLRKNNLLNLHRGGERFDSLGGLANLKDFCRRALQPVVVPPL